MLESPVNKWEVVCTPRWGGKRVERAYVFRDGWRDVFRINALQWHSERAVFSQPPCVVCADQVWVQVFCRFNIIVSADGRREFPQKMLRVAPSYSRCGNTSCENCESTILVAKVLSCRVFLQESLIRAE